MVVSTVYCLIKPSSDHLVFGTGISNNIREAYSFVTTNYIPGDEIVLIGFSRGAFTVRSVAALIRDIGLLTRSGMEYFYAIFKDSQNARNPHYHDIFPDVPFPNKPPAGKQGIKEYRRRLESRDLTRVYDPDGRRIGVLAVAVWDTVGALGIPTLAWMQKMGIPKATKDLKFFDTSLTDTVRHAFQALALDEHRAPFSPAVWELRDEDHCNVDLRQCWFAGAHSNCGGGYPDQEMANITLAWMMDQLASIGLEFHDETIEKVFLENKEYYLNPPPDMNVTSVTSLFRRRRPWKEWAIQEVYEKHRPVRPWALGMINEAETGFYKLTVGTYLRTGITSLTLMKGFALRTPGRYRRADPDTGEQTRQYMTHTNERIHRSVRIRLDLQGLDVDDIGLYKCRSLFEQGWDLRQRNIRVVDPIPYNACWGGVEPLEPPESDSRWVWEYVGSREDRPIIRTMVEENIGPYERRLLMMNKGRDDDGRRRRRRRRSSRPPRNGD